ncbi:Bug family tripartite tricarboxylate transporter substrate binding protein [Polaromonas sp.]|uniref:Bug family tripartite tricarboxylate transporter substrate binding protein n=1 Tax=Polaromonas sp. TaxID=1869339 RepID=UPI003BAAD3D0
MNSYRRLALAFHALFFAALFAGALHAQTGYPSRPVTLVVPYPPGGSADILARTVGQKLSVLWGQPVIVDNRAGAGTAIGAKAVASAPADGYTLLMGTVSSHAINPAMNKVGYDPVKDFTAVAPLASVAFVLVAHPSFAAASLQDLVAMARAKPGEITYASAGPGTSNHLAGVLLEGASRINLLHVPYKGSAPALSDVLAGHVKLMFDLQATALPYVNSGRLRALAITSKTRSSNLPNVPTMVEGGVPGYEASAWFGIFAPAALPRPVTEKINQSLASVLKMADVQKQLRDLGAEPESGTPEAFSEYVRSESVKWAEIVKSAGASTNK